MNLTELEFIYYSVGLIYFQEEKNQYYKDIANQVGELFKYFSLECADIKTLLFDIDACCRGIGGVKKLFDVNKLPSVKNKTEIQTIPTKIETDEERLERHKKFFEELKNSFCNK